MSNLFKINIRDVAGAVLSAVIVAILGYLSHLASIWNADPKQILDVALLTGVTSLLKAIGTDSNGAFMGSVKVK